MEQEKDDYNGSTPLTGRYGVMQEAFIDGILANIVQFKAYKQAGYKPKSDEVARVNSSQLLTKPNIKARLAYKRAQLAEKTELSAEIVINKLREIAFNDAKSKDISPHNQLTALDMLSKHLGLYSKDNDQKRELTLVEIVAIMGGQRTKRPILESCVESEVRSLLPGRDQVTPASIRAANTDPHLTANNEGEVKENGQK